MRWRHFDQMASAYAEARPPYPEALYRALLDAGVIGAGRRVLEIGAGAGLATRELVRLGTEVVAIEPGAELAAHLRAAVPFVDVIPARLEVAALPSGGFDAVVAATALHWVDLSVGLPLFHAALRPEGWLASWRHSFHDDRFDTEFRERVRAIVGTRAPRAAAPSLVQDRPTMAELAAQGLFEPVGTEEWAWSIDLTAAQVVSLFRTFSNWSEAEAEAAGRAADDLGGVVTEHYRTILHLLRKHDPSDAAGRHEA